jgi:TonB family protein
MQDSVGQDSGARDSVADSSGQHEAAGGYDHTLRDDSPGTDDLASRAVCEIVYQVDNGIPSPRGYRYVFFGNGFFINGDGYLLTAAHVLSQLHGGQPYLLLRSGVGTPRFVRADVVATDRDHDVAILHATPSPLGNDLNDKAAVSFLPLASETPTAGEKVQAADLRPSREHDSYSGDPTLYERLPGQVLRFEFSQLEKGASDTELFLVDNAIRPGQSGGPVISDDSQGVAGFVEGQWLREDSPVIAAEKEDRASAGGDGSVSSGGAGSPGAAVPIHYAIALLQRKGVAWHAASENARAGLTVEADSTDGFVPARPLSLVPAPYPPESLFGGEVVLDALVGRDGMLSDVKVVRGEQPFLQKALGAVRTWTFFPARAGGQATQERIAIAFQFPQPYVPARTPTVHHYDGGMLKDAAGDGAAVPVVTVEPEYPSAGNAEGSVVLYESIDREGQVTSAQTVSGVEGLTAPALAAASEWRFAPAKRSGEASESTAIVVVTFRHPLATASGKSDKKENVIERP